MYCVILMSFYMACPVGSEYYRLTSCKSATLILSFDGVSYELSM